MFKEAVLAKLAAMAKQERIRLSERVQAESRLEELTAARKVADAHLHTPIRKSETLPVAQQVNFAA